MITPFRQFISNGKTTLYRRPKEEFGRLIRYGPRAYFRCDAWAREMEAAAWRLQVIGGERVEVIDQNEEDHPVSLWFLTGKRFWYQTAFCAWTFAKQSGRKVVLNLVDDGSLEHEHEDGLRRLFPEGVTLGKESVRERIETLLPCDRFPILRTRWDDYINIRKLTDIHLGSAGVKLVLDSDMLFFRRPDALLTWWDEAVAGSYSQSSTTSSLFSPCLMIDCMESYGYSRSLMTELAGVPIPEKLNVGICGLRSEDLDWDEMEQWCRTLLEREGTSYYLEQAIVAMVAARTQRTVMSREDYITFPSGEEIKRPSAVLQHYVADSKPGYFGIAWKTALRS